MQLANLSCVVNSNVILNFVIYIKGLLAVRTEDSGSVPAQISMCSITSFWLMISIWQNGQEQMVCSLLTRGASLPIRRGAEPGLQ